MLYASPMHWDVYELVAGGQPVDVALIISTRAREAMAFANSGQANLDLRVWRRRKVEPVC